jgi:hypothetical protein
VLGIVGDRYRIVQNHEAFQFVDQLIGSQLQFETAGSLCGGRRVWVLARLPEQIEVGGDPVRPFVLLMNSHDGSTAVIAATTPVRLVCQNTCYANVRIERDHRHRPLPPAARDLDDRRPEPVAGGATAALAITDSQSGSPANTAPAATFKKTGADDGRELVLLDHCDTLRFSKVFGCGSRWRSGSTTPTRVVGDETHPQPRGRTRPI